MYRNNACERKQVKIVGSLALEYLVCDDVCSRAEEGLCVYGQG